MTDTLRPEEKRPGALERFLGERPFWLALRLLLISLVVGFLMQALGLEVRDLVDGVVTFVHALIRDGLGQMRPLTGYVVTGAAVVVPVWLLLRLMRRR